MNKRMRKARARAWVACLLANCERYFAGTYSLDHFHAEACRWEHVMSETVERRLLEILGQARDPKVRIPPTDPFV